MVAQAATISQLPVSLLARILAFLEPAERLGSAALVATAWSTAAVLGTDSIELNFMKVSEAVPKRFDSLSVWLASNSYAGITALSALMPMPRRPMQQSQQMPVLQLPSLERLPGLECLHCYGVAITATQGSSDSREAGAAAQPAEPGGAALMPLQLSAVTALTGLQFYSCNVTVEGLASLTRLQSLTLGTPMNYNLPEAVITNSCTQLQHALPQLQALELLRLFGEVACDDVLQHVSKLPRLQELILVDGMFTLASFQQLPQSLTHLGIGWAADTINTTDKDLTASTAPGLCALTILREFEVHGGSISVEVLANLTSLKFLNLSKSDIEGPGTLSALTALTQLTYLSLPYIALQATPSDPDVAAVTASSQLVELIIHDTYLTADTCKHLFPAGRQLLQLTQLCASLDLIHDGREATRVAACCPNLECIILTPHIDYGWWEQEDDVVAGDLASMLGRLQHLQHLTRLTIDLHDLPMLPGVWQALARLTQLRELKVNINDLRFLAGALNLTDCTRLQSLCIEASSTEGMMERVCLDVTGEEAADGTTDLAQQLPKALQQATLHLAQQLPKALQQATLQQVSEENGTPELLSVLVRCAAEVQQAQEQQLAQQQGEIAQLRRETAQQQEEIAQLRRETAQQQGEIAQLRRELRGLQDSLAAVTRQQQGHTGLGTS